MLRHPKNLEDPSDMLSSTSVPRSSWADTPTQPWHNGCSENENYHQVTSGFKPSREMVEEEEKHHRYCWCGCVDEEVETLPSSPELPPVQSKVKRKSREVDQKKGIRLLNARLLLGFLVLWMLCLDGGDCQEQWSTASDVTASFYGDSHLWLALQDASSVTELTLNFRTRQRDALLMLAAGDTDYCLLELRNGRLRVRINLGSGESVLQSPRGLRLDDYLWHTVQLSRRNAQATLTVNRQYVSHLIIPGVFYQLNIIHGLYLGGLGQFRDLFLGNFMQFRGCMRNIKFNTQEANRVRNWDILRTVNNNQTHGAHSDFVLQHIRWDCDEEFSAKNHEAISFLRTDSFATFNTLPIRQNGTIAFEFKTIAGDALILYNGGSPSQPDYLAVDIVQGRLRFQVDKGNGAMLLQSEMKVNDGSWHNVSCQVSTAHLQLSVDGRVSTLSPRSSLQRYLDLDGSFYVGGMDTRYGTRSLRTHNLYDRAFSGCLRDLRVNEVDLGFENMLVSNGLAAQCLWEYPCQTRQPCLPSAACYQIGLDGFRCDCATAAGRNQSGSKCEKDRQDMINWAQVLHYSNFSLKEGAQHTINQDNIRVIWNYQGESIRHSQIVFHVQRPARHGRLEVNLEPRLAEVNTFTYLDVMSDRVLYIHDGSERPFDHLELTIHIPTNMGNLSRTIPLTITVLPENDLPKLLFPNGPQMEIVPGTVRTLSADVMRAIDPDSSNTALRFSLLQPLKVSQLRYSSIMGDYHQPNTSHNGASFDATNTGPPSLAISEFTQADIDAGLVEIFFNGSLTEQDLAVFSVSDGINTSKEKSTLSIIPLKLSIHAVTNKGLSVPINSSSLITQNNLSFATNAIHQNLTIVYAMTQPPAFGRLERLYNNTHWTTTKSFTQDDINTLAVRYVHLTDVPSRDAFRVRLSALPASVDQSISASVQIRFMQNKLKTVHLEPLTFTTAKASLTKEVLLHEQEPVPTSAENIVYVIKRLPSHGLLQKNSLPFQLNERFSQADVNAGALTYTLTSLAPNRDIPQRDHILLDVGQSPIENKNPVTTPTRSVRLVFKYDPAGSSPWKLHDFELNANESGNAVLSIDALSIEHNGLIDRTCSFSLASYPEHGMLQTRDQRNVSDFTVQDLEQRSVFYRHDGSESQLDVINLIARCRPAGAGQVVSLQVPLLVNIQLSNNHRPTATRLGPLFLIQNSTRLLTTDDILLDDEDVISSPKESLQFVHRGLQNADLLHLSDRQTPIFRCSQSDIMQKHILIRHKGPLHGESTVYLQDGEGIFSTEKMTIQAEALQLSAKETLMIPRTIDTKIVLKLEELGFQTNADVRWNTVVLTVQKGPKYGTAVVQQSVIDNRPVVVYRLSKKKAELAENLMDSFVVQFDLNNSTVFTLVNMAPLLPVRVSDKSEAVLVKEHSSTVITSGSLSATHPLFDANHLVYSIVQAPNYGFLSLGSSGVPAQSFSQSDVDHGRVQYVQEKASSTFRDHVVLQAHAPVESASNATLSLTMLILPSITPRITKPEPYRAKEGGLIKMKLSDLLKDIPNADHLPLRVQLKAKPTHGKAYVDKEGALLYTHDGSETLNDTFSIAIQLEKLELTWNKDINVLIQPLNDRPPQLFLKKSIDVWQGQRTALSDEEFEALDEDSDADLSSIVYFVQNNSQATIVVDGQPTTSFTTQDLESRRVGCDTSMNGPNTSTLVLSAGDGKHQSEPLTIPVRVVTLQLVVSRNESIEVARNASLIITSDELDISAKKVLLKDNRELEPMLFKSADLSYDILRQPQYGFIGLLEGVESSSGQGVPQRTDTFTQKDLQEGRVAYVQSSSSLPADHTHPNTDRFYFSVRLTRPHPARLDNLMFDIKIRASSDSSIRSSSLIVPSGSSVLLKRLHLDATRFMPRGEWKKIQYTVVNTPKLGTLNMDSSDILKTGSTFSQTDINKHRLNYQHFGKEAQTTRDTIVLDLSMPQRKPVRLIVNITIATSDTHLKVTAQDADVVSGDNLTLTQDVLRTNQDSNPTLALRYRLFKEIRGGQFLLRGSSTREFSQRDIISKAVMFCHDGVTDDPRTIPVQLETLLPRELSASSAISELVLFNIHVIPFYFRLDNQANMTLLQGTFDMALNTSVISIGSNADKSRISYQVLREPRYGHLRSANTSRPAPLKTFTQIDVDKSRVFYQQTALDQWEDSFMLQISLKKGPNFITLPNKTLHVTVAPLAKMDPITVAASHTIPISLSMLDATALKTRTGQEPTYRILSGPLLGSLMWANQTDSSQPANKSSTNDKVIWFRHDDLVHKRILYKSPSDLRLSAPGGDVHDTIVFLLTAGPEVQTARGTIQIKVKQLFQSPTKIATNDTGLIAGIVVTIVLAAALLFAFLVVKCRKKEQQRQKRASIAQHAHLSPLFGPKGHLIDSPDSDGFKSQQNGRKRMPPATVPSCKVIPIRRAGKNFRSAETELHPLDAYREDLYGTAAHSNGFLLPRTETTPVLSKNQYWV